jgi:hypothetical protein
MFYLRKVGTFPESPGGGMIGSSGSLSPSLPTARVSMIPAAAAQAAQAAADQRALSQAREDEQVAIQHSKFTPCWYCIVYSAHFPPFLPFSLSFSLSFS